MDYDESWRSQRIDAADAWLNQVRNAAIISLRTLDELEAFEECTGVKGTDYSAVRVSSSPNADNVHDLAVRHMELDERHITAASEYMELSRDASAAIDELDDSRHQRLLTLRYLRGKTWEGIVDDMNYSESAVYKMRRDALDALYDHIPPEFRTKLEPAI